MRKLVKEIFDDKFLPEGENMEGWVTGIRDLNNKIFVTVKDRTGEIQVVSNNKDDAFRSLKSLNVGDVVSVTGSSKEDKRTPGGVEILPASVQRMALCETPVPIPIDHLEKRVTMPNLEARLDARYLDLRDSKVSAIFKTKSKIANSIRDFFISDDFMEIHTPKIVMAGAEGGSNLFQVEYFEKDAYLAQSPQFYKQMMMASGLERVYEIAPAFRAEPHNTPRHLTEFTSVDAEMSFIESEADIMDMHERMLVHVLSDLKKYVTEKNLPYSPIVPERPFPRIEYNDAVSILNEFGALNEDNEIKGEGEAAIGKYIKEKHDHEFVFLTKFPKELRPVYAMPEDGGLTKSFDLLYKGMEITTGGQRIHGYENLKNAFKARKIPFEQYSFYTDAFRYGMPPHGGFGMGLERLVKQIVGADNIKEAVLFPRDKNRLSP